MAATKKPTVAIERAEPHVIVMDDRRSKQLFASVAVGAVRAGISFLQAQLGMATPPRPAPRPLLLPAGGADRGVPALLGSDRSRIGYDAAAQLLAIPIGTLRSMVCRRQVPHIRLSPRIVVFDVRALQSWLAARAVSIGNDNDDQGQ